MTEVWHHATVFHTDEGKATPPQPCTRGCLRYLRLYCFLLLVMLAHRCHEPYTTTKDNRHHSPQR